MEAMLQQILQSAKGKDKRKSKGKGKEQNKMQKVQHQIPAHRLTRLVLATSRLALNNARAKRQTAADLTHTAFNTAPAPGELNHAIETTIATKGTDRRLAAKATLLALVKGFVESKKLASGIPSVHTVLKRFYTGQVPHLDEKIIECKVALTHDENMVKTSWWIVNFQELDEAVQDALVFLGADVRHGLAPMYGDERDVLDAMAEVTGSAASTAGTADAM